MRRVFSIPFAKNGVLLSGLLRRCKSSTSKHEKDLKIMDDLFEKLSKSSSKSLLKKHLKPDVYKALRTKRTKTSGLLDCIQSGLKNHDSGCGIYAPDAEAYQVFSEIFDPIIEDYHFGFKKTDKQPQKSFGNPCKFTDLDPHTHYIASTRIRCARSIKGFPFNPCLTKQQYDDIEDMVHCTLRAMGGELKGHYHPLFGMPKSLQKKLIDQHYLFKEGDRFLQDANSNRFWPIGRGIYHNFEKTFVAWVNEEDHIRIISMQRGGDFGQVFGRLVKAINALEAKIRFARHDRLGYLTFCPTNLGTTIRASVHIRLPKLTADKKAFHAVADKFKLQVRGTRGEHSDAEGGIYDISNKRRLGITENQAVSELYTGVAQMIRLEKGTKGKAGPSKEPKVSKSKPKQAAAKKEKSVSKPAAKGAPKLKIVPKPCPRKGKK